jgi:hypothetical protein
MESVKINMSKVYYGIYTRYSSDSEPTLIDVISRHNAETTKRDAKSRAGELREKRERPWHRISAKKLTKKALESDEIRAFIACKQRQEDMERFLESAEWEGRNRNIEGLKSVCNQLINSHRIDYKSWNWDEMDITEDAEESINIRCRASVWTTTVTIKGPIAEGVTEFSGQIYDVNGI